MGSPLFAASSLEELIKGGFNVVAVITSPNRKKGRGQLVTESDVKKIALKYRIPVFQPNNLKDELFIKAISQLNPDLGVVVAFRMLPEILWTLPTKGTINLHASLLPNYRGAAPINWVLINGEKKTGITTFFLKHEIDTGDVLLQEEIPIAQNMDAGVLHDELMMKGAELLSKTVELIENNNYQIIEQKELVQNVDTLLKAPKIFKNDCEINWENEAQIIYNFIRGLSPYPGAWNKLLTKSGKELIFKVYRSEISDIPSDEVGKIVCKDKKELLIGTADFYLKILSIQIEGKKRMEIEEFLKGFNTEYLTLK